MNPRNDRLADSAVDAAAKKLATVRRLLDMIKPMIAKPRGLSREEQNVFEQTAQQVSHIAHEVWSILHDARYPRDPDEDDDGLAETQAASDPIQAAKSVAVAKDVRIAR